MLLLGTPKLKELMLLKKLFLDDVRTVDMVYGESHINQYYTVRSYNEFINFIKKNGLPDFISFDNDLGLDEEGNTAKEGYDAAKWLVYESNLDLKNLKFKVHSSNPVAKKNIYYLLSNYIKYLNNKV